MSPGCSQGTCGPDILRCWHAGDPRIKSEWTIPFLARSYGMWAWKIGEEVLPLPIAKKMVKRRKAKSHKISQLVKAGRLPSN